MKEELEIIRREELRPRVQTRVGAAACWQQMGSTTQLRAR